MSTMEKVRPAAPVAPWLGGKKALSAEIVKRIEAIDHTTYAEPFVGMGGVFFRRSWKPKLEVANDLNGEITNLFRIIQQHLPQLLEVMKYQIASRREFERLREAQPSTLTDLQRAARFLYLQRLSFGGKPGDVFGVSPHTSPRFQLSRLEPLLDAAHERLENVVFENLDWCELIRRYDKSGTLFYLDPPYWGGENDYGKGMFDRSQFTVMANELQKLQGKFILSINDRPEIRELFDGFHFQEVKLKYSVSKQGSIEAAELLISNYEPRVSLL